MKDLEPKLVEIIHKVEQEYDQHYQKVDDLAGEFVDTYRSLGVSDGKIKDIFIVQLGGIDYFINRGILE